jgi:hypothetical protein
LKQPVDITPRPPETGRRRDGCYAGALLDCCDKLSHEHFLSRAVLRQLGDDDKTRISGLAWQAPETFNVLPLKSLGSKILCKRHNEAMSGLDAQILRLAETLQSFDKDLAAPTGADTKMSLFAGEDIERWMLKAVIGGVESENLEGSMRPGALDLLFGRVRWPMGWGIHFNGGIGDRIYHSSSFALETIMHAATKTVIGVRCIIRGFPFVLLLANPPRAEVWGKYRPGLISLRHGGSERRLVLTWTTGRAGGFVKMTKHGSYAGAPPNWSEWQKSEHDADITRPRSRPPGRPTSR